MRTRAAFFCLLAAGLVVTGCGGVSEKDLVGDWSGKMTLSEADKQKAKAEASKDNPAGAAGVDALANMEIPLTLKEDKTFTMTMLIFPVEGKWELKDGKVVLTTEKMMGMDINAMNQGSAAKNEPMVLTIEGGGKTLSGKRSDDGSTMTFTKKAATK